jgi:RNA polymerase sigma-70 factor (ECF subfamily)
MQRYCEGESDAFRKLYEEIAPRLRGYLRSLLRDDATAEDVLQQTFLKLHCARSTYVRGMDPVPWLYAIGRRTCIDEMRRRAGSRVRLLGGAEELLREVEATSWGTPTFAGTAEAYSEAERDAVLEALDELTPRQRAALALTKLQGLTMSGAARTLGTTEGAVKICAHRAYARLRELLGRDEMFHDRHEASLARSQRTRQSRASGARR